MSWSPFIVVFNCHMQKLIIQDIVECIFEIDRPNLFSKRAYDVAIRLVKIV